MSASVVECFSSVFKRHKLGAGLRSRALEEGCAASQGEQAVSDKSSTQFPSYFFHSM